MEEPTEQAARALAELAADEIQGLDAVCALVDGRDPRIAQELLDTRLADETMATVDLYGKACHFDRRVGQERLDDRGEKGDELLGAAPGLNVRIELRAVHLASRQERE